MSATLATTGLLYFGYQEHMKNLTAKKNTKSPEETQHSTASKDSMFKESVVAAEQEADLMFAGDTGGARQFKKTN